MIDPSDSSSAASPTVPSNRETVSGPPSPYGDHIPHAPDGERPRWWTPRRQWRVVSWAVLLGLTLLLFRTMFSQGQLVVSDFYVAFPATVSSQGWVVYLSQWNPGLLGYASAQPASVALFSLMTVGGLPAAFLQPLVIVGLTFVGAASFQYLLEPYLIDARLALLGATLFLLSPYLFIGFFDSDSALPFALLLPTLLLLTFRVAQSPTVRRILWLSLGFGLVFALVSSGPAFALPLVILPPLVVGLTRRSIRAGFIGLGGVGLALVFGLLLNAPFYLGNLGYFNSGTLSNLFPSAIAIMPVTYGFSTPLHFFSLLGAGLYPRYSNYYPATSEFLLLEFTAAALCGLVLMRTEHYRGLGALVGATYAFCAAWIFLTKSAVTYPLYEAIGYLTALNYPDIFYAYIAVCLTILATLMVDGVLFAELRRSLRVGVSPTPSTLTPLHARTFLAKVRRVFLSNGPYSTANGGGVRKEPPTSGRARLRRRAWHGLARRPLTLALSVLLVILLAVPAGFYLQSGNFEVFDAPHAYGFPAPWGAAAPPVFYAMYDFLQTHGGALNTRVLILPFPGEGAVQFSPFAINNFDLYEYQGSSSATNLFTAGAGSNAFTTTVLNYLVSNQTDRIGVLLGEASVKYVLVDRTANFTGPPQWTWGSLVGSPSFFLGILRSQTDLEEVFSSDLFVAFLNLDYRPYVTGASGVAVVQNGNYSAPLDRTVGGWPANLTDWSAPSPPSRIAEVEPTSTGYEVVGVNNSGVLNITFSNVTDTITASSSRFDNDGVFVQSTRIPVTRQGYAVQFQQAYTGPSNHGGPYVTVWGFDAQGAYLWGIPSYAVIGGNGPNGTIPFEPLQLNPNTTSIAVSITFPYQFGSGTVASYSVSNLSLVEVLPPPPSSLLADLVLTQLPPSSGLPTYAPIPSSEFSNATATALEHAGTPIRQLCLDLCASSSRVSDQLFFAYASLDFTSSNASLEAMPGALAGEVVAVNGSLAGALPVSPSPFSSVAVRASGDGTVALFNGTDEIAHFRVESGSLQWYGIALPQEGQTRELSVLLNGTLQLDSVWLGRDDASAETAGTSETTTTSSSLTEYDGTLGNATRFVVLAQGYNPAWAMTIGSDSASSVSVAGWENGFVVSQGDVGRGAAYRLVFTGQSLHTFLIGVQAAVLAVLLFTLVVASWPWLRGRLRKEAKEFSSQLLHRRDESPRPGGSRAKDGNPPKRALGVDESGLGPAMEEDRTGMTSPTE